MSIKSVMLYNHHPLPPPSPDAVNLSHQAAKVYKLQLHHQSFNEYSGLIPVGLIPVGLTGLIFLKHQHLKASRLQCLAFFMVQLSHLCMTTGKQQQQQCFDCTDICCLLFKTLPRFVIAFLPRIPHLLIPWL